MNKLTETDKAKEYLELCQRRMVYDESTHIIASLLSLLEEKDKALQVLADKNNWTRRWTENSAELVWIWTEDGSPHEVAQAALTSSNNEGVV